MENGVNTEHSGPLPVANGVPQPVPVGPREQFKQKMTEQNKTLDHMQQSLKNMMTG